MRAPFQHYNVVERERERDREGKQGMEGRGKEGRKNRGGEKRGEQMR